MNSLPGSEAGNSVINGSPPHTTALPGVVPHPAAAVDRYLATGAWGIRSLPAAFRQAATTHAGRTALITPDTQLTYRELDARSDAVAAGLLSSGLRPGERVLLQLTNSATAVVAWYALLKAGLIPVCTLAIHRRLEIEQIGRKSGAVAHLVQADFPGFDLVGLAQQVAGLLSAIRQLLTVGAAPGQPGLRIEDLQDHKVTNTERAGLLAIAESLDVCGPAVLQLSGGTTGTPKIIPRLHAEYRHNADLTAGWWGHTEHSVLAFGLPLAHNAALANGLHAAHGAGAALLLATPAADVMLPLMAEHGATWTMSPPGLAQEYLSHPAFDDAVARLGTWVLTAAQVPRPVFDELTGRGVHVTQAFGMSEGLFLFTPLDAPAGLRAETVGVPISPHDEVRVLRPGTEVEVAEGERRGATHRPRPHRTIRARPARSRPYAARRRQRTLSRTPLTPARPSRHPDEGWHTAISIMNSNGVPVSVRAPASPCPFDPPGAAATGLGSRTGAQAISIARISCPFSRRNARGYHASYRRTRIASPAARTGALTGSRRARPRRRSQTEELDGVLPEDALFAGVPQRELVQFLDASLEVQPVAGGSQGKPEKGNALVRGCSAGAATCWGVVFRGDPGGGFPAELDVEPEAARRAWRDLACSSVADRPAAARWLSNVPQLVQCPPNAMRSSMPGSGGFPCVSSLIPAASMFLAPAHQVK